MGMQAYVEIGAVEIADAMVDDPEFAMDVLGQLALRSDQCAFHEGDSGSVFHSRVAAFLEATAGGLRAASEYQS